MRNAEFYIQRFNLQAHPEGGFFVEISRSQDDVIPVNQTRYQTEEEQSRITRSASTSIYFLLKESSYSAWHVLKSDEMWIHNDGCPVKIYTFNTEGIIEEVILGNPVRDQNADFQYMIKAGTWFSAELMDPTSFALVTCVVTPGFVFQDFALADKKQIDVFVKKNPAKKELIERLAVRAVVDELRSASVSRVIGANSAATFRVPKIAEGTKEQPSVFAPQ